MLTQADDFPIHRTPEPLAFRQPDRNFYDRYFFSGYAPDGSVLFAVAWRCVLNVKLTGVFLSTKHRARLMLRFDRQHCVDQRRATRPGHGGVLCREGWRRHVRRGRRDRTRAACSPCRRRGPGLTEIAATAHFLRAEATRSACVGNIAAGRAAQVEETAGLIAYLASPEAADDNRETVHTDGTLRERGNSTLKSAAASLHRLAFLRRLT